MIFSPNRSNPMGQPIKWATWLLLVWSCFSISLATAAVPESNGTASEQALEAKIAELVNDLGHTHYANRLRARKELQRLGLLAFDALHAAQANPNSEIAVAARYLLGSLQVMWASDSDPEIVREILAGYGTLSAIERETRLRSLARLSGLEVMPALLRLTRFETDLRLSREAALAVLGNPSLLKPADPEGTAQLIREILSSNSRPSSLWLKAMADELVAGEVQSQRWQQFIHAEQQRLRNQVSRDLDTQTIFGLYQKTCERLAANGQEDKAKEFAREAMMELSARSQDILMAVQWAGRQSFWESIFLVADAHPDLFAHNALLLYWQAQAYLETGEQEKADTLSNQALELAPLADTSDQEDIGPVDEATLLAIDEHMRNADLLKRAGRRDWAERALRYVIDRVPVWEKRSAEARWQLVLMLQDQDRHGDAAEILEPLLTRIQRDGALAQMLGSYRSFLRPDFLKMRFAYHQGMGLRDSKPAEARKSFEQVLSIDSQEIDTLIALFRLPGDKAAQEAVQARIVATAAQIDASIALYERSRRDLDTLGEFYNNYAWLISNTEGNQELALERARRAVELNPESAAELDTLARCLFVLNRYDEAIRTQQQAIDLDPTSEVMKRQLKEFQAVALQKSNEAKANPPQ